MHGLELRNKIINGDLLFTIFKYTGTIFEFVILRDRQYFTYHSLACQWQSPNQKSPRQDLDLRIH